MKYPFLFLILLLVSWSCSTPEYRYEGQKMKGVSLVAPSQPMDSEPLQELQQLGVEWVSLMPYAFARPGDTVLHFNVERQWWGERDEGIIESVRLVREAGMQIMLKPHIWLQGGFHGDIQYESEEEWLAWERAYTGYILHFARLADSLQLPLYCIGTELKQHTRQRPHYWQQLIDAVREVYGGQLTYADNWDSYGEFPHWDRLDYIGIDAYFPLSQADQPSLQALSAHWQPHLDAIGTLASQQQKPVLFTEWGYRSVGGASREPWRSDTTGPADLQAQATAYKAFFQTAWPQKWLAGAFLWKWYPQLPRRHHRLQTDYTPQGKPAQEVVREYYAN
ncbi:glycoside hydrolase family 113 [Cesiribacter andamanensis]|uniref:Glycoside hydrolase n=1 Tax=Cesiribacter andamanensis AMV16 TaxID=1279009 RepID=M7N382_9BACT|nr:hypothetical protein [Cesiribacter andamanensis]EMR03143.1 hypothetical protein ADICEAN_01689 [Cesiribacter andamanensis AMV16]